MAVGGRGSESTRRSGTRQSTQLVFFTLETTSMFKQLIPVVALALIAGPVFAADAPSPTPSADTSTAAAKPHHKKHHNKAKTSKSTASSSDTSTAPAK